MEGRRRVKCLLFTVVLAALGTTTSNAELLTNELLYPVRIVDGKRVDISALVQWHKAKLAGKVQDDSARPLPDWHVVKIERIVTSNITWIVRAEIDGASETILLNNPPRQELDQFYQWRSYHALLLERTNVLARELRRIDAERRKTAVQQAAVMSGRHTAKQAVTADLRAEVAASNEATISAQLATTLTQLRQIEAAGIDFNKPFPIECLALKTSQSYKGMPVYDRGAFR